MITAPDKITIAAAIGLHDGRRYAEAGRLYRCLIARRPDDVDALRLLGQARIRLNNAQGARALLQRGLACIGHHADLVADLGASYQAIGDQDRAALIWRIGAAIAPRNAAIQVNLAARALATRSPADADRRYRRIKATGDVVAMNREFAVIAALVASSLRDRPRRRDRPRYLLIRPWVCGFWGEVYHVAVQLAFAEISGRVPVVYWGPEVRYGARGYRNAWDAYFEPVSDATLDDVTGGNPSVFPPRWANGDLLGRGFNALTGQGLREGISSLFLLNTEADVAIADGFNDMSFVLRWADAGGPLHGLSPEVVFRRLFKTRIRALPEHRNSASDMAARLFQRRPVIAVHYRTPHIGKRMESIGEERLTLADYFRQVDGFLARAPEGSLFLLTDFEPAVGQFRERYGDAVFTLPATRIGPSGPLEGGLDPAQRVEKLAQEVGLDPSHDGQQLALEVLIDTLVATHADVFLGDGASGVSAAVSHLKDWPPGSLILLRRNVFDYR